MNEPNTIKTNRTVLIVSDGTGITAETFCHAVLAQFGSLKFKQIRLPFVDSLEKALETRNRINQIMLQDGIRPIVFSTLVNPDINSLVKEADALFLDLFTTFVVPLEQEFGVQSTHSVGRFHQTADSQAYKNRIEAINYSLTHDDGQTTRDLEVADVILVGVSRSGKTPTSLYLAMQYGLKAANCPLIPEDFARGQLPSWLPKHKHKIFGLSISPERLSEIRNERRPNSRYAAIENCRYEVQAAEEMMAREKITWLSSTSKSIEEIATTVIQKLNLDKGHF